MTFGEPNTERQAHAKPDRVLGGWDQFSRIPLRYAQRRRGLRPSTTPRNTSAA